MTILNAKGQLEPKFSVLKGDHVVLILKIITSSFETCLKYGPYRQDRKYPWVVVKIFSRETAYIYPKYFMKFYQILVNFYQIFLFTLMLI